MRVLPSAFLLLLLFVTGWAYAQSKEEAKSAGRTVVKDLKQAGRAIRDSKVGKEVGHAAAEGGREVARVSKEAARDVRSVTVQFWDRLLEGKRRRVAELEKENRELKKRDRER